MYKIKEFQVFASDINIVTRASGISRKEAFLWKIETLLLFNAVFYFNAICSFIGKG